ncbi:MAG TPA: PEGA domain-containing protein [Pyrinomonadaceae bacterium]|nr:PEGA domain-containing protein [Pyrinomonadaceae bacterium]
MRFAIITGLLIAGSVTAVSAQGGGGRSESVRIPTVDRPDRPSKRSFKTVRNTTPKISLPDLGRVAIKVSEGESQLQISRDGTPIETINLPERSTSLIIRKLDVGSYTIAAKKPGFHDVTKVVEIEKNQGRRVSIDLRPKMAILSVASNVPDAKISIANLGDFERPVEKALVKPGSYLIKVSRRGYVSREVKVYLKTAGREERLNLILEPLRVDAVLDLAFEHIKDQKFAEAEALANDVLELNPQHARANLALGFVHLHRAETEKAVDRILQAVGNGETFSLPVTVRVEPADAKKVSATLNLDSRVLRFESSERPGLNFSITRTNLGRPDVEANAVIVSGNGDYLGRIISPRLQVYTEHLETLRFLLAEWRK